MSNVMSVYGHRVNVMRDNVPRLEPVLTEIVAAPDERWDTYDNPFERKCTFTDKFDLPKQAERLVAWLESSVREQASLMFGVDLRPDDQRHYCGIFKYRQGDHLGVHVDAGIHPLNLMRKHVTAVLYLGSGDGALELWRGDAADSLLDNPGVEDCFLRIEPEHGKLVLFENNDYAWHGVTKVEGNTPRVVVTVSYLSLMVDGFFNKRRRAFFVPRPDEHWSAETWALRDKRADPERFAEAYRA